MITACLLNSDYPDLLNEVVLPALETSDLVSEIIISHGNPETVFEYTGQHCDVIHRHDYGEINNRYGLSRRWLCWQQSKNDAVLSLGDTSLCWQFFIAYMYERYRRNPNIIYTPEGGSFTPDFALSEGMCRGEVPLASGRCMLVHKRLADACLEFSPLVEEAALSSTPKWRDDDIFASLVSVRQSNRLNYSLDIPLTPLDNLLPDTLRRSARDLCSPWHRQCGTMFLRRTIDALGLRKRLKDVPRAPLVWEEMMARKHFAVAGMQKAWREVRKRSYNRRAKRHLSPSFMLLGPERGGTSSLFYYLNQHPQIKRPKIKETEFYAFGYKFAEPLYPAPEGILFNRLRFLEYKSKFPRCGRHKDTVTGEASPQYFYMPEVPARIKADYPDMRFIVTLRNPADRAWSLYHMYRAGNHRRKKVDKERAEGFSDALDREESYRAKGLPFIFSGIRSNSLRVHLSRVVLPDEKYFIFRSNYSYLSTGVYVFWLRRWLRFFKREQFLILQSEDLFKHPEEVTHRVLEFIGLKPTAQIEYSKQNVSRSGCARMPADIRQRLNTYFFPYNRELYELTGKEFDWS